MNLTFRRIAALLIAAILSGGGGGDSVSAPTKITQTQAVEALTIAKTTESGFHGVSRQLEEKLLNLLQIGDSDTPAEPNGSSIISTNCRVSGRFETSYRKAIFSEGLNGGDKFIIKYIDCIDYIDDFSESGNTVVTATSAFPNFYVNQTL